MHTTQYLCIYFEDKLKWNYLKVNKFDYKFGSKIKFWNNEKVSVKIMYITNYLPLKIWIILKHSANRLIRLI